MELLVYNVLIRVYHFSVLLASPFSKKARLFIKGRKRVLQEIDGKIENCIWFHVSSLGEFEQGRPLIEKIKKESPDTKIALSFFSSSGMEIRRKYPMADLVFYLPQDSPKNAEALINAIKPKLAILVKYDLWYHYINGLHKRKIPILLIAALFRRNQIYFKNYWSLNRKMLLKLEHIFVQNEYSKHLLSEYSINAVSVAGDPRIDRVVQIAEDPEVFPMINYWKEGKKTLVAGSTWRKDEKLIASFMSQSKDWNLLIAPHDVSEKRLRSIEKRFKESIRLSKLDKTYKGQVVLVDGIGYLSSLYQYGDLAYIGGGFGRAIHNTLEPAAYGIPIIFGPSYKKFKEAIDLVGLYGAYPVKDGRQLKLAMGLMNDKDHRLRIGRKVADYISKNKGGTERIVTYLQLNKFLKS